EVIGARGEDGTTHRGELDGSSPETKTCCVRAAESLLQLDLGEHHSASIADGTGHLGHGSTHRGARHGAGRHAGRAARDTPWHARAPFRAHPRQSGPVPDQRSLTNPPAAGLVDWTTQGMPYPIHHA